MISGYHQQVADHYERFPYPQYPWYAHGSWRQLESVDLRTWGIEGKIENAWIAGCGTIAPLMFGRRNPAVAFFATDLSTRSLRSLKWRLTLFGIRNVRLAQEDILESAYADLFDAIDCFGVLHHTVSPQKALSKMARALRPGGVMRLMVYSREARSEIENLRRQVVEQGLKDLAAVENFLNSIDFVRRGDLLTRNGIADALLNPIVSTFDETSLDQLIEAQANLKILKRSSGGNFVTFLRRL